MEKKWKCTVCGYIHEGAKPPDICPVCGAHKFQFILYEKLPDSLETRLKEAFAGESKAHVRNLAFAQKAEDRRIPPNCQTLQGRGRSRKSACRRVSEVSGRRNRRDRR